MRNAVRIQGAGAARGRTADSDVSIEGGVRAIVHDQQRQPCAGPLRGANTDKRIVTGGADELVAAAGEVLQQPIDIKCRIGVSGAGRIGAVRDAVVAVLTPSIKRR